MSFVCLKFDTLCAYRVKLLRQQNYSLNVFEKWMQPGYHGAPGFPATWPTLASGEAFAMDKPTSPTPVSCLGILHI